MAKNVLFLLHGVGRHSPNWAFETDGPVPTLERAAQRYSYFRGRKLSDIVEIVPLYVDDIYDRILKTFSDRVAALNGAGGAPDALKMVLSLNQKATDAGRDDLVAYGADVPLYRGFPLFAKRIQLAINLRIAQVIADKSKAPDGQLPKYVVVAHSLGTAMAHDSIHLLGTENWLDVSYSSGPAEATGDAQGFREAHRLLTQRFGTANPFAPGFVDFRSVFMISNTSRLLQTVCAPDKSLVCPIPRGSASAYCQKVYNVDHRLDPISKIVPFQVPAEWPRTGGGQITVEHLHEANVHGFAHYLENPKVHLELLMDLIDDFEPTEDEIEAVDCFPVLGGRLAEAAEVKRRAIEESLGRMIAQATSEATNELERWLAVYDSLISLAGEA